MELPALNAGAQLWWLCAVLPVLLWLALPPRPRRLLFTAHRAQWLLAQAAVRRRTPRFSWLRWLLLSLAAVFGTLAAARPTLARPMGATRLVALLDGSASMAQRTPTGTAFGDAVARLRATLAALPRDLAVEVVQLSHGSVQRWSGPAARALAEPGPPGGTLPATLRELAAAAEQPGTAVWTLSDGQGGEAVLPLRGALTLCGRAQPNAAVLAVALEPAWPTRALRLRIDLVGFLASALQATLAVQGAVEPIAAQTIELPPGQPIRVELDAVRRPEGGLVEVHLQAPGDGLSDDDRWQATLPPLPELRIAVHAEEAGAEFARKAGRALADAVGGEVVAATVGTAATFLLAEGGQATLAPGTAPMVAFGVAPGDASGGQPKVWPAPLVVDWDRQDPLLAGLDLSELVVAHALADALPPGRPLLLGATAGGTAPLGVAVTTPQATSLHFAFRLQDSNLALLPAFPQLLLRAFRQGHQAAAVVGAESPAGPQVALAGRLAEADLRTIANAPDRPLPPFAEAGRDLAPWCLCLALLLLALRAAVP